jgi:hypothetical protein
MPTAKRSAQKWPDFAIVISLCLLSYYFLFLFPGCVRGFFSFAMLLLVFTFSFLLLEVLVLLFAIVFRFL